jgi:hypothetical protein
MVVIQIHTSHTQNSKISMHLAEHPPKYYVQDKSVSETGDVYFP